MVYPSYSGIKSVLMLILTYVAYTLLGMIALNIIIISVSITNGMVFDLLTATPEKVPQLLDSLCSVGRNSIPFGELFEELLGSTGSMFAAFSDLIINSTKDEIYASVRSYSPNILRDISVISLTHLIYFIFKKLKQWLGMLQSCLFSTMLTLISVIWVCASFCLSDLIVFLLEAIVVPSKKGILYLIIFLVSIGIHSVTLAFFTKRNTFIKLLILLLEAGFDCIRALCIWFWVNSIAAMYSYNIFSAITGTFIFVSRTVFIALLFWVIEMAEKHTKGQYEKTNL